MSIQCMHKISGVYKYRAMSLGGEIRVHLERAMRALNTIYGEGPIPAEPPHLNYLSLISGRRGSLKLDRWTSRNA